MTLDAIADRAAAKLDRAAFLARVEERRAEFAGLLDDEALGLLVLDELGLNESAVVLLKDLKGHDEATVVVDVVRVHPPREFQKEPRPGPDGAPGTPQVGRVMNVDVRDGTASAKLVLWGRDIRHAEEGDLKPGARAKVVNARVKDSRWGLELHCGPWTRFEVDGALDAAHRKLLLDTRADYDPLEGRPVAVEGEAASPYAALGALPRDRPAVDVKARLLSLSPTRTFQRRDGSVGFVTNATLEDATGRVTLVCWDDAVRAVRKVMIGCEVVVKDAQVREKDGRAELHTGRTTVLEPQ